LISSWSMKKITPRGNQPAGGAGTVVFSLYYRYCEASALGALRVASLAETRKGYLKVHTST
jgi:hypothetical protein